MSTSQADIDNMSDEELMNFDASSLAFNSNEALEDEVEEVTETVTTETNDEEVIVREDNDVVEDDSDEDQAEEGSTDITGDKSKDAEKAPVVQADTKAEPKVEAPVTEVTDGAIKEFYAKITAPFKANGRDMQVANADEAVQLMQMGANYNKKMAALKPNLAFVRMLENAGLLDESKLSYLIDLSLKKPEAISKLVKDSGIDPLEISTDKADEYRPTDHRVSPKAMALDEVLNDLKGTDNYARTLSFVSETLDDEGKQVIADNPQVLRNLHKHIEDGVFDQVWAEVERQRTFNHLSGLSDLEAYRQVGEALATSGKLQQVVEKANPQSQVTAPAKVIVEPKPKQADDSDRNQKRKAASPTKAAISNPTKVPQGVEVLGMSDADFLKSVSS